MRTQEVPKKENIPAPVRELLRTLRQAGYEAYPVGAVCATCCWGFRLMTGT